MFSKACEYAFQGILYIALHQSDSRKVGLKEISESQGIPMHFLGKILQGLVKSKVLLSVKGPNGGFGLRIPAEQLRLITIVEQVDGSDIFERCGIGLQVCSDDKPCPIHHEFKLVKQKIRALLSEKTIAELIEDVEAGRSFVNYVSE